MDHETRPIEGDLVEDAPAKADRAASGTNPRGWAHPGRAALALGAVATLAGLAALAGHMNVSNAPPAATTAIVAADAAPAQPEPTETVPAPRELARSEPAPPEAAPGGNADAPPALRIMTFAACIAASACEDQSDPATTAALSPEAQALWQGAPLVGDETEPQTPLADVSPTEAPPSETQTAETLAADTAPVMRTVPLPVRRPQEFRQDPRQALAREMARREARSVAPMQAAAVPATPVDNRSAFETLFGVQQQPASPAMAYAALDSQPAAVAPAPARRALAPAPAPAPVAVAPAPLPAPRAGGGTAIYDITAKTVTLPNGERLEAHSGLGDAIDDPRRVHERMKGSTPPGTYDLTWRETSFHGVQALRMTPVGGSAAIHGRTGILAHHNLRGPSGESNGCVSFRNYERFRQAYARGEVSRLVVVPGGGGSAVSSFVSRLFGGS